MRSAHLLVGTLSQNFKMLAEWTGLEPATPGVTGRYSNQLNYHSMAAFAALVSWQEKGAAQVPHKLGVP
jgi:hypothetical protein